MKDDKAMEGREIQDGVDMGDKHFHEVGWNTTLDAERVDLEQLQATEIILAEAQAEAFAQNDLILGISAFKGLIAIYKDHPNVDAWQKRINELEQK